MCVNAAGKQAGMQMQVCIRVTGKQANVQMLSTFAGKQLVSVQMQMCAHASKLVGKCACTCKLVYSSR